MYGCQYLSSTLPQKKALRDPSFTLTCVNDYEVMAFRHLACCLHNFNTFLEKCCSASERSRAKATQLTRLENKKCYNLLSCNVSDQAHSALACSTLMQALQSASQT